MCNFIFSKILLKRHMGFLPDIENVVTAEQMTLVVRVLFFADSRVLLRDPDAVVSQLPAVYGSGVQDPVRVPPARLVLSRM